MSSQYEWDVRTEGSTVIVEFPPTVELDQKIGEQVNEEFFEAVSRSSVTNVMTVLKAENPLNSKLFEELKRGADEAAANGITHWAIVVQKQIKGMAFESSIDGLETEVFDDQAEAREFLN